MEGKECIKCASDESLYKYKGQVFCEDCLMEKLKEEKVVDPFAQVEGYMWENEYLGDDTDVEDVLFKLQDYEDVKKIN